LTRCGIGRAVAALVILAAVASSGLRPATAQAQAPDARLVSQSLVVPAGGPFSLVVDAGGSTLAAGTELAVTVNGPLEPARFSMRAAMVGAIEAPTVGLVSDPLESIPRDAAGRLDVTIPTVVRRAEKTGDNIRLATNGLYAVRVDLRSEKGEVLSRFTTFLVRVDDALLAEPTYPVAIVLSAESPPTLQADGSTDIDTTARQRLRGLTQVLTRNATMPLTLVVRPTLLEGLSRTGLAADGNLVTDAADAVGGRPLVSTTRDRVDPASLVAANLSGDLATQLRSGEDVLVAQLGDVQPSRTVWLGNGVLNDAALGQVRDLGARQIVLAQSELVADDAAPVDATAQLATGGDAAPLVVAAVDDQLAASLEPGPDPVLSAYRLVAELVAMDLDAGAQRGLRGVVIMPTPDWQPDAVFLGTFLDTLAATPLLQAVGLADWFAKVRPANAADGTPVRRLLAPLPVPDLTDQAKAVGLTRLGVGVYGSMLGDADAATLSSGSEALLTTSLAADLTNEQRAGYVTAVGAQLSVLRNAVENVPERRITLAGRHSEIPITLHSKLDKPITVKVRLSSAKLTFPEGDQTVLLEGTEQLRIPVETRASGTFPVIVQVLTPVGDAEAAPAAQLTVQVPAFSGFGIVLIVGLLIVLATWWVHHVRSTRRRLRAAASTGRHPTAHVPGVPLPPP
jgi:hypothetical protein